ncbi:MAG: glycosyltransferase, partial [Simkaniaceae bacterium]|nr:glycosyltransferase [Simkaniaceae bacterium]
MQYKSSFLVLLVTLFVICAGDAKVAVPISDKGEQRIVVVVASYNNQLFYRRNLDFIFAQDYENYHVLYVNDCSTDDTKVLVENYIKNKGVADRITLINNPT